MIPKLWDSSGPIGRFFYTVKLLEGLRTTYLAGDIFALFVQRLHHSNEKLLSKY